LEDKGALAPEAAAPMLVLAFRFSKLGQRSFLQNVNRMLFTLSLRFLVPEFQFP
jgi:hypothetical protein